MFSSGADAYAKYRPHYPSELFDYILSFVQNKEAAWDCATGNGQAAAALADRFKHVEATDISEAQLKKATIKENIHYSISAAEKTSFQDDSFDLITVATAYHWFDWDAFYNEATRVGKQNAVVAVWAYNILQCDDQNINQAIHRFYFDVMYKYWDEERRHVENGYQTVVFNFAPLPSKDFFLEKVWKKDDVLGYISTWSAVQHYQKQNGASPLPIIQNELESIWPANEVKRFRFPLFLKIGRIVK